MTNLVLHADADSFFASVALRSRPHLREVPMAVVAHMFVASANYPARARGISGAMPTQEALRRCPELVLLDIPRAEIEEVGDALFDLFHECALAVEPGSIEEAFLDVGAGDIPRALEVAARIRARAAAEIGIPVSVGIGRTKLMAKLASKAAKPDGVHVIDDERAAILRRTLPLAKVWGIGEKTVQRAEGVGVRTLGDLDGVLPERLLAVCGPTMARRLWGIREGSDDAQVRPVEKRTSLSAEGAIAGYARPDWTGPELIRTCVERVAKRVQRAGLVGSGLTLALRPEGEGELVTLRSAPFEPTTDARPLLAVADNLFAPLQQRTWSAVRVTLTGLRRADELPPTLF